MNNHAELKKRMVEIELDLKNIFTRKQVLLDQMKINPHNKETDRILSERSDVFYSLKNEVNNLDITYMKLLTEKGLILKELNSLF